MALGSNGFNKWKILHVEDSTCGRFYIMKVGGYSLGLVPNRLGRELTVVVIATSGANRVGQIM